MVPFREIYIYLYFNEYIFYYIFLSFNRTGNLIATLFGSGELIIWDTLNREIVHREAAATNKDKILFMKYRMEPAKFYDSIIEDFLVIVKESGIVEVLIFNDDGYSVDDGVNDGVNTNNNDLVQKFKAFKFARITIDQEPEPERGHIILAEMSKDTLFLLDNFGNLTTVDLESGKVIRKFTDSDLAVSESSSGGSGITGITCHYERNILSLVCKNRTIRIFEYDAGNGSIGMKFKLSDAVNKWPWKLSGFSHHDEIDSMIIFGTALSKGKHLIYLWDNVSGSPIQTLEGPKEEISVALWHPTKPQLITVGALSGKILVWGPDFPQKWSALVPNIESIETNIEYIEREDEFDLPVDEEIKKVREINESVQIDFKDFINDADRDDDRNLHYPLVF